MKVQIGFITGGSLEIGSDDIPDADDFIDRIKDNDWITFNCTNDKCVKIRSDAIIFVKEM